MSSRRKQRQELRSFTEAAEHPTQTRKAKEIRRTLEILDTIPRPQNTGREEKPA